MLFLPATQFQTLRSMVQRNPQILQVCVIDINSFGLSFFVNMIVSCLLVSCFAAHASGAREAKPSTFETDPGAS